MNTIFTTIVIVVGMAIILALAYYDIRSTRPMGALLPTVYDIGRSTSVNTGEPPAKRMRFSVGDV